MTPVNKYHLIFFIPLVAALFLQTFGRNILLADYFIRTSAYAANCENKQKPELKCKGKCQMMKKMQEEEEKNKENPERRAENKLETSVLINKEFFPFYLSSPEQKSDKWSFTHAIGHVNHHAFSIFHPPRFKPSIPASRTMG